MHQQLQNLIIIYCIVSFLFLLTVIVRLYNGKDITFLRKTDFFNNCDYWCISHFILYFLLGYFAPKYWYISFILSILWECAEYIFQTYDFSYIKCKGMKDVKTNTIGLLLGTIVYCITPLEI